MTSYRVISIMKRGDIGHLEFTAPDDFTAIRAFDFTVREHRKSVLFATLMKSDGAEWQTLIKTGK